jgi:hypothetical protein
MKTPNYRLLLGIVEICITVKLTLQPSDLGRHFITSTISFVPILRLVNWATKYSTWAPCCQDFIYRVFLALF